MSISLSAVYDYPQDGGQKLIGYQFSNQVDVTVRDLTKVAAVIDGAIAAGANTVDGVTFSVNDPVAAESQARTAAMADAKARAEIMQICDIFRAKIIDVQPKGLAIEITGSESKIEKFLALMQPFGITDLTRTGKIALARSKK